MIDFSRKAVIRISTANGSEVPLAVVNGEYLVGRLRPIEALERKCINDWFRKRYWFKVDPDSKQSKSATCAIALKGNWP